MRTKYRSFVLICVAVAMAFSAAQQSRAQAPLAIDFEDVFTPDFLKRDHPTFKSMLMLDDGQATILESLLHDYNERFEGALVEVREDLRAAQQAMGVEDPRVAEEREQIRGEIATLFEEMQEALENLPAGSNAGEVKVKYEGHMQGLQQRLQKLSSQPIAPENLAKLFDDASRRLESWREERARVRQSFVDDLMTIINTDQQTRWPSLERRLYRERTIGRNRLQGEGVDMTHVVRDMRLDDAKIASIATIMLDYEVAMDAALKARNQLIDTSVRSLFTALQTDNRAALTNIISRITQTRVAVRDVNDDTASALAAALPSDGPRLLQAYRVRGYPQVYRDTPTMRLIKAAQEMPGISDQQKQTLAEMRQQYTAECAAMDESLLASVRRHEPDVITQREVISLLPPTEEDELTESDRPMDAVQTAFEQRSAMGQRFDAQLESILGEDLYQRLPRNNRIIRDIGQTEDDGEGD